MISNHSRYMHTTVFYLVVIMMKFSVRALSTATGYAARVFAKDAALSASHALPVVSGDTTSALASYMVLERCDVNGHLQVAWHDVASKNTERPFSIDFVDSKVARRGDAAGVGSELVVKAVGGVKKAASSPLVFDLTAGLGRDAFVMASAGFHVCMFERNAVLHALLEDALERLGRVQPALALRLQLCRWSGSDGDNNDSYANAISAFGGTPPDVCYLDPMYQKGSVGKRYLRACSCCLPLLYLTYIHLLMSTHPHKHTHTRTHTRTPLNSFRAAVKKETQVLHRLLGESEGDDEDNSRRLLEAALAMAVHRVAIKRPSDAPPLAGAVPHEVLTKTSHRCDLFFPPRPVLWG